METKNLEQEVKKPRILVAEDEPVMRELISMAIKSQFDNDIYLASDGEEALDKYILLRPDLLITDLRMPRMDGITLFHKVRDVNPYAKVILMSGFYNDQLKIDNALKSGAAGIIHKPFKIDNLFKSIEDALKPNYN